MVCIETYNLLKEGDLYNDSTRATHIITTSGALGLYDNNYDIPAFSIPSSGTISVVVEFGEFVNVCSMKYYVSSAVLDDITVTYGTTEPDQFSSNLTMSGSYINAEINYPVGFMQLTHSGSVGFDVYQLDIHGYEHEYIGFGKSSVSGVSNILVGNSPIGYVSSDPQQIDVYNEWNADTDVFVTVAPTLSGVDDTILFSTTKSGTFYDRRSMGPKQPSHVPITISGHSLGGLSSISSLYNDWYYQSGAPIYLDPRPDFLRWVVYDENADQLRIGSGYHWLTAANFVSTSEFTGDQSFTVSIEVRFIEAEFENMQLGSAVSRMNKFLVGFTNSYPIVEYHSFTQKQDSPTYDRMGQSLCAIGIGPEFGEGGASSLLVGTFANDDDFLYLEGYTSFFEARGRFNENALLTSVRLADLSSDVFAEATFADGLDSAPWRKLVVSYNHQTNTAAYFIDHVPLGQYEFSNAAFSEGCKFFFGFNGVGSTTFDVRNILIEKDVVRSVHCRQRYAGAYDSVDLDGQPPDNLIDNRFGGDSTPYAWVSNVSPILGDHFEVGFGTPQNIDAVRIKQPLSTDLITISGALSPTPRYALNRTFFYFDTGDIRYVDFIDPPHGGLDYWNVAYFTTLSGTVEPVVGATLVSGVIETLHDRGAEGTTDVLAIDQVQFFTTSGTYVESQASYDENSIPWRYGYSRNLARRGDANVYELKYTDLYDVSTKEHSHQLIRYADYNVTNPVWDNTGDVINRHYAETLFIRDGRGTGLQIEANMAGSSAAVWRYFEELATIKAVFFTCYSNPQSGTSYESRVDEWKLQYLRDRGDPNVESDWIDIPPITSAYPTPGDFATYTQYMVDNNDGEFYTSFLNSMDSTGNVTLPSTLLINRNRYNTFAELGSFQQPTVNVYVEFDRVYRTQGIRLVINKGYKDTARTILAEGYTLSAFVCYAERAIGSYVSPVFDTGTPFNSEHIQVSTKDFDGSSTIMYRSSSSPPNYSYDPAYEMWEDMGQPYAGMQQDLFFAPFQGGASMVHHDGTIYFVGEDISQLVEYNLDTRKWSFGDEFPIETEGSGLIPDFRTSNNLVLVGDSLIMAGTASPGGGLQSSSMLRYILTENEYGYSGWDSYPYQRQEAAIQASMVSDGTDRVFFLARTGQITVFYLSTGDLDEEGRTPMPLHGAIYREDMIAAYHQGKIYVAGGSHNSSYYFDIYDVDNDVWESGPYMPYPLDTCHAFYYDGFIYVFPIWAGSYYTAFLKYDMSNGTWHTVNTLGYNYKTSYLESGASHVGNHPMSKNYCQIGDFIYAYDYLRDDFRRVKLKREAWETGRLPGSAESVWWNSGGRPWEQVTASGELMPQDRYVQYKVVLECDENVTVPVLKSGVIAQPLRLPSVPASGTSSFWIKTGISLEREFESWYTGFNYDEEPSIIYTLSDTGYNYYNNLSAVTTVTASGGSRYGFVDSYVIEESGAYEMWTTFAKMQDGSPADGNIYATTSSNGYEWGAEVHVVGHGLNGTYDTTSIYGPTVLKGTNYRMWYTAVDNSGVHRILHAESSDGFVWSNSVLTQDRATYSLEPDADLNGVKHPTVVKVGGVYHMWYEGLDVRDLSRIIHCVSDDGLNWAGHKIVLEASDINDSSIYGVGDPHVIHALDVYHMWFTVYRNPSNVIYYAFSNSGVDWFGITGALSRGNKGEDDISGVRSLCTVLSQPLMDNNEFKTVRLKMYNGDVS